MLFFLIFTVQKRPQSPSPFIMRSVCLSIPTNLAQQHWPNQWHEFRGGASVFLTNSRFVLFYSAHPHFRGFGFESIFLKDFSP